MKCSIGTQPVQLCFTKLGSITNTSKWFMNQRAESQNDSNQQQNSFESFNRFETFEYLWLQVSSIFGGVALSVWIFLNRRAQSNGHVGTETGKNIHLTSSTDDNLSADEFNSYYAKFVGWNTAAAAALSSPTIFTKSQQPTTRRSSKSTKRRRIWLFGLQLCESYSRAYDLRGPPFAISANSRFYFPVCFKSHQLLNSGSNCLTLAFVACARFRFFCDPMLCNNFRDSAYFKQNDEWLFTVLCILKERFLCVILISVGWDSWIDVVCDDFVGFSRFICFGLLMVVPDWFVDFEFDVILKDIPVQKYS